MRCIAGPEPDERTLTAGAWTLRVENRVLEVEGPSRALRIAAVSAPGLGGTPNTDALARLREANADLVILLGGVGEAEGVASGMLKALASLSTPSLVVLGGRDTWAAYDKAFEDLPADSRIINGTVLRAIRIGYQTLLPVAGAEGGRYALHASACGFDETDLDTAARELGPARPKETRWLLSWQAPARLAGAPGPRTESGAALGSVVVARFAEKVGARGGLYAWPVDETAPLRGGPLGVTAVPRLFGPHLETSTGARLSRGLILLEVASDGVRVVL